MSKLVLFGVGTYYEKFKNICSQSDEVIGIIDSNPELWGTDRDGIIIRRPEDIKLLTYDYVLPLCAKPYEMQECLIELGVVNEKICYFEKYRAGKLGYVIELFQNDERSANVSKGKVLVVSTELNYNGGSLAAVYAAKAIQNKGYEVVLAAPEGNSRFIEETVEGGIDIAICPGLPYITDVFKEWMDSFDLVIVNVFQMIVSACEIGRRKPTLWWIHECSSRYEEHYEVTRKKYPEYENVATWGDLKVVGVSSIAADNFNSYYPGVIKDTLPYGIPDEWNGYRLTTEKQRIVFSVIGNMCVRKAQKLFLEAFFKLDKTDREQVEIWFMGSDENKYGREVKELAKNLPNVKTLGIKSRDEIMHLYDEVDVVVCCSLEETMSITMTEGMMRGKICLCTDLAGMADYIEHGKNGFVFESGNVIDLADKIRQVLYLGEEKINICRRARETYEENFAMDVFGDNLEKLMLEVKGEER